MRAVAKEIGTSPATLSRIENGSLPDLGTFPKLCKWLGIDPSEILGLDDKPADPTAQEPAQLLTATAHLRAKRQISPELAKALGEMILRAQDMLADEPGEPTDESTGI